MKINFELDTNNAYDRGVFELLSMAISTAAMTKVENEEKNDAPASEEAKTEEETPADEVPVVEKPKRSRRKKVEETPVEEAPVEEPVAEETTTEEPVAEETSAEEPTGEMPFDAETEEKAEPAETAEPAKTMTQDEWQKILLDKRVELKLNGENEKYKPAFNAYVKMMASDFGANIPRDLTPENLYRFVHEVFNFIAINDEHEFYLDKLPF